MILKIKLNFHFFHDISDHLLGRNQNEIIPDETDVDGASLALGRLHGTYRFNLSALISESILSATIQGKNYKYATLGSLSG